MRGWNRDHRRSACHPSGHFTNGWKCRILPTLSRLPHGREIRTRRGSVFGARAYLWTLRLGQHEREESRGVWANNRRYLSHSGLHNSPGQHIRRYLSGGRTECNHRFVCGTCHNVYPRGCRPKRVVHRYSSARRTVYRKLIEEPLRAGLPEKHVPLQPRCSNAHEQSRSSSMSTTARVFAGKAPSWRAPAAAKE